MSKYIQTFAALLWCFLCAGIAIGIEFTGQVVLKLGHGLMWSADRLSDYAAGVLIEFD